MNREASTLVSTSITCCALVVFGLCTGRVAPVLSAAAALVALIALSSAARPLRGSRGRR